MKEGASILPKWEDPQRNKLEFSICCIDGPSGELFGEVHEVMSAATRVLGNLEKDLVRERCGEIGER